jgi:hypothetical protein
VLTCRRESICTSVDCSMSVAFQLHAALVAIGHDDIIFAFMAGKAFRYQELCGVFKSPVGRLFLEFCF